MPKSNSQQKSTPDTRTRHQHGGGMERSGQHCIGWGPARRPWEQSEGAILDCGRAREKINRPEHTSAGRSQNKGTETLQRRASLLRTGPSPLEVGGRREGKGANSAPEKAPPPTLQTGPQFFHTSRRHPTWACAETEPGASEGKGRVEPRESALVKPLAAWAALAGEGTKRRHNRIRAFVEYPKTGTARSAGPAPCRAAGSLSSVDRESTDTRERGKPSVARNTGVLPTHSAVCSAPPSL